MGGLMEPRVVVPGGLGQEGGKGKSDLKGWGSSGGGEDSRALRL